MILLCLLGYNQDDKDFYQYLEFRLPNPPSILPFLWSCCFGRNEGTIHPPNEDGVGRNPMELIPLLKSQELNTDSQPNSDMVLKNLPSVPKDTLEDLFGNKTHMGQIENHLRGNVPRLMEHIKSPRNPNTSRFNAGDLRDIRMSTTPFHDLIKNWKSMGKVRRPYVSDLLRICIQANEIGAADYIYRNVLLNKAEIDGENKKTILDKYSDDIWGEGLNR